MSVDFSKVVTRLNDRGWSYQKIVNVLGLRGIHVTRTTISALKTGKTSQPRYELGVALVELAGEGDE